MYSFIYLSIYLFIYLSIYLLSYLFLSLVKKWSIYLKQVTEIATGGARCKKIVLKYFTTKLAGLQA